MMILSLPSPSSTARSAESRPDCTIASCITSRTSSGSGALAFLSIRSVSMAWSSEPQLTPMRTGRSNFIAVSIIMEKLRSFFSLKPTLPGLMRYFASASAQAG